MISYNLSMAKFRIFEINNFEFQAYLLTVKLSKFS